MALVHDFSLSIQFADASKRTLKFSGISESTTSTLKARTVAIKAGTDGESTIGGWKELLLSSGGASATDIVAATYTATSTTAIYDSSTYSE